MLEGRKAFVFPENWVGSLGNTLLNKMPVKCPELCCPSATEALQYSKPLVVLYAKHEFFWSPKSKTTLNMFLK